MDLGTEFTGRLTVQNFDWNIVMIVVGVFFFLIAVVSGILIWAVPSGLLVSGMTWFLTKDIRSSVVAGIIVATVVTGFGIANFISPGWYGAYL